MWSTLLSPTAVSRLAFRAHADMASDTEVARMASCGSLAPQWVDLARMRSVELVSAGTSLASPARPATADGLLSRQQYSAPAVQDQLQVEVRCKSLRGPTWLVLASRKHAGTYAGLRLS